MITGSRAEYGLLRTVMRAVKEHPKLKLQTIVTGMHLLRSFGHTVDDIRKDGWRIDGQVSMYTGRQKTRDQASSLSRGVSGIAKQLEALKSDIVVVLGDRLEAVAGALAGVTTNRFVAHIHGGDVAPGHLDDTFRHAITKLAHLHLAASDDAARRIIRLGEKPASVHVVGAPGLDDLRSLKPKKSGWLSKRFELMPEKPVSIVLQHPTGRSDQAEGRVMSSILRAVEKEGFCSLVIYPNSDPGHAGIVDAIQRKARSAPTGMWHVERSLPRAEFLQAMMQAKVLIGNSSCGIIEAASVGLAVVNVGDRQLGRLRASKAVFDCRESETQIRNALRKSLDAVVRPRRKTVYGDGQAGKRIAGILLRTKLSDNHRRKIIAY